MLTCPFIFIASFFLCFLLSFFFFGFPLSNHQRQDPHYQNHAEPHTTFIVSWLLDSVQDRAECSRPQSLVPWYWLWPWIMQSLTHLLSLIWQPQLQKGKREPGPCKHSPVFLQSSPPLKAVKHAIAIAAVDPALLAALLHPPTVATAPQDPTQAVRLRQCQSLLHFSQGRGPHSSCTAVPALHMQCCTGALLVLDRVVWRKD